MIEKDFSHIPGWGMDADERNDPTYPMKHYSGDDHKRMHYTTPPPQKHTVEILRSNERPSLPAVYGDSVPPTGLSGKIRRKAFQFSENAWTHWLGLLAADRINMFEGIVDDFKKGVVPNVFAERGMKAQWKYGRTELIRKVVITGAVVVVACWVFKKSRSKRTI